MRVSSGRGPGSARTIKLKLGPSHKRSGLASGPHAANGAAKSPKPNSQLRRFKARAAYTALATRGIGWPKPAQSAAARDPKAALDFTRVAMPTLLTPGF